MPLRSIITYRGANEPKTTSVLKLNAQSPFSKDVSEDIFSKDVLGEFCQLQPCFEGS